MTKVPIQEGRIPLSIPNLPQQCYTWYRLHGTIKEPGAGPRPLVILHGGPGIPHNYIKSLASLSAPPYNRPVIFYDQLGCGNSTHLPAMTGTKGEEFWTVELFLAELEALVQALGIEASYDVLGHSWGGMLASEHAVTHPKGLNKMVVADSPANMADWIACVHKLRKKMPQNIQDVLDRCEREGRTDSKEYADAILVFYRKHICRLWPWPSDLDKAFELLEQDDTVYKTLNGPSELYCTGTLKHWSIKERLHKVKVPTLLLNGRFDEAQDKTVAPYFTRIVAPVKWVQFAESSHLPHWEERERYMQIVDSFLGDVENE